MNCYATLIIFFLGRNLFSCSQFPLRTYHYVNLNMSWADAQQYCRMNYNDLATFESMTDISMLKPGFSYSWAWIGLNDDPNNWKVNMVNASNSWRWSATGETSKTGYQDWGIINGDPNDAGGNEDCVIMGDNGLWHDVRCQTLRSVLCYNITNQNQTIYMFTSNLMTWNSAQAYCRQYYIDLPTIENSAENTAIYSVKTGNTQAWIGLYRVPWLWSDKSQSLFKHWLSGQPDNNNGNEYCAAENSLHEWADWDCRTVFPFICHQVSKLKTLVRLKITDITNPAMITQILQQLGAVLTSHGWTDFNLQLKIQPRNGKELTESQCNLHL